MKLNWNFLGGMGGGGGKTKTFHGGSVDTFWNYTLPYNGSDNPCGLFCLIC